MKGILSSLPWLAEACKSRAIFRSALYGDMNEVKAIVEESAKSFATYWKHSSVFAMLQYDLRRSHLCNSSDVLIAILFRESKVSVEAESHIVAIKAIRRKSKM